MVSLRRLFWILLLWISGARDSFKDIVMNVDSHTWLVPRDLNNALYALLRYADSHVALYHTTFSELLSNGRENVMNGFTRYVPILDKRTLKERLTDILSDEYRRGFNDLILNFTSHVVMQLYRVVWGKDFIVPMTTGGTTGAPLTSYKSRRILLADGLLFLRGWYMTGWRTGDRMLLFYHQYYENNLSFVNALSWISGIKLSFFVSLDNESITKLVHEINIFTPKLIVSFPSYIYDVALTIEKMGLKLAHFPDAIEVSGETLFEHQRKKIEEVLRCKVYDSYGTVEFGMIAHECSHAQGMHIYEDLFLCEHDEEGALLVTRLDMHESPIIRYRVGDKGTLRTTECPCGRSGMILEEVSGRIEDYVVSPEGARIYPSLFRQVINAANQALGNSIVESRILQDGSRITCQIVARDDKKEEILLYMEREFSMFFPTMHISIAFVETMRDRKKFRFIERI